MNTAKTGQVGMGDVGSLLIEYVIRGRISVDFNFNTANDILITRSEFIGKGKCLFRLLIYI